MTQDKKGESNQLHETDQRNQMNQLLALRRQLGDKADLWLGLLERTDD